MNRELERRVIGFFASDAGHLLLDDAACVVTGTPEPLHALLAAAPPRDLLGNVLSMEIRKIRFGAIMQGLSGGGSYAFDEVAYNAFFPLANQFGFSLQAEQFGEATQEGVALVTISADK